MIFDNLTITGIIVAIAISTSLLVITKIQNLQQKHRDA